MKAGHLRRSGVGAASRCGFARFPNAVPFVIVSSWIFSAFFEVSSQLFASPAAVGVMGLLRFQPSPICEN